MPKTKAKAIRPIVIYHFSTSTTCKAEDFARWHEKEGYHCSIAKDGTISVNSC